MLKMLSNYVTPFKPTLKSIVSLLCGILCADPNIIAQRTSGKFLLQSLPSSHALTMERPCR